MSLSDLPDDILNLISIRLNGFDNCSLWMASDSKLKERLVNNIITDFDINYTIPGRYLWPGNFLKRLSKLSRLSLVADNELYHLPIQNIEIHPIPTLRSLRVDFENSHRLLQLTSSNDPTGPTTSSNDDYYYLNEYYPNLEDLEIINLFSNGISFSIDFLRFLPQKLKTLMIPSNLLEHDVTNPSHLDTIITTLPQTLTKLHVNFDYPCKKNNVYLDLSKLPPNLTSLTTNAGTFGKSYKMIPKSLKSFILVGTIVNNFEKLSTFLPTGLESLSINIDNPLSDQHLSTSHFLMRLEKLENLTLSPKKPIKLDHFISNCPKLKKLICKKLVLSDLQVPSRLFSDNLTRLSLKEAVGTTAEFISSLPQSLTGLTLLQTIQQPFAFFSLLPRKLKSLYTNFKIVERLSLLPDSLTYLRLTNSSRFDSSYFDQFPPKLETLIVKRNIPRSMINQLPAGLKVLHVVATEAVDDEIIRMLPRSLKELTFDTPDEITDASIADLPPSLEGLMLYNNKKITDDAIERLPRSLMHLSLPENPNFTDKCIKHLPPHLVSLSLNAATKITSKPCKDLPRYLKFLFLPNCQDWDPDVDCIKERIASIPQNPHVGKSRSSAKMENGFTARCILICIKNQHLLV